MNKNFYKTIFSKSRGEMIVVAENISSEGQTSTSNHHSTHLEESLESENKVGLKLLSFSMMLVTGAAFFCMTSNEAYANIVADPNAATNNRPTILSTSNGLPQVNIQTPSKAGVSMNHYQQFDVNQNGVILNNSHNNAKTQLAGYVQANPWLAGGEAKVIVNQVNTSNATNLNGYIEVAGRKADVIIANPMGINIDGGGFINAGGVTLTTSNPLVSNGNLTGFQIREGLINITGQGLDTSTSDYTRLLSYAAQINAGIWAKDLKIVAGINDIDAQNNVSAQNNNVINQSQFAIDTSNLGGMYAGKISLISTEKGVGINNAGQIFASAGNIKISADGQLHNTGSVVAQHQKDASLATLDIETTTLNNSGSISSLGRQSIQSNEINNTGLIATSAELNIRNQQKVNNQGELNAGRFDIETLELQNTSGQIVQTGLQDLVIETKTLTNSHDGLIGYTEREDPNTTAPSSGTGNSQTGNSGSGTNTAPSTAAGGGSTTTANTSMNTSFVQGKIKADHIENDAGKITANGGVDLVIHNRLDNSATLNLKKLDIQGDQLNNQNGELNAATIQANINTLNNEQGVIRSSGHLNAQVAKEVNNKQGHISSGQDIQIHDADQNTLSIDNTAEGKIVAAQNLKLQAKSLENTATIVAGKDLNIDLNDHFNVVSELNAGQNLTLKSQQEIVNSTTINAGKNLSVQAVHVENQKTGVIQSNSTVEVTSDDLLNKGLINSNGLTHLNVAEQIENIGTGRIYGDHVAVQTGALVNAEEFADNETKSGVIAARQKLVLAAQNILNQEGALISSQGDIAIGRNLDAGLNAVGEADLLINSSARIEAQGNGLIAVKDLKNLNNHFQVEEYLANQTTIQQWSEPGSSVRWTQGVDGTATKYEKRIVFNFDGLQKTFNRSAVAGITRRDITSKEYKERITESKPGEIVIGGNLEISGEHWENNNSQILVGGTLSGNDNNFIENKETLSNNRIEETGQTRVYRYGGNGFWGNNKVRSTTSDYYNLVKSTDHFEQPAMVMATNVNNIQLGQTQVDTAQVGSVQATDDKIKTLTDFNTQLPTSSLFHTNPNNPSYLIETDPAFTNYKKWLGSDYMLSLFNTDPQNMHKRLGDGYYEQKLINDQIAKLTGYRRLEGYQNDEEQFKSLMDEGVTFAQTYNLTLGIALSPEQVARLTSDMVWLVNQTVTLADGTQQTVLVPQVYLKVREGDLNSAGALISANDIHLKTASDILNAGTVAGRQVVDISAQNISNSGLVQSKAIVLNAQDQILFEGGQAKAEDLIALNADRVRLVSTTQTTGDEQNGNTSLDRVAALYVTGKQGGVLSVEGTNGIDAKGADIVNLAQQGKTQLRSTNGDIHLDTIDVAYHESYGQASNKNHLIIHQAGEVGTQIQTAGDVSIVAQNEVNIRQGSINSDQGQVSIYGQNGVNIIEGRATEDLSQSVYSKSNGLLSSTKTLDQFQHKNDEAVSSVITGKDIAISSGSDLNAKGSQIIADNLTQLTAEKDINITAAENTYENREFHQTKKSGLFSSGGFGVTIGSVKESTEQTQYSTETTASSVGSLNGNTNIIAGKKYQQTGTNVSSVEGDVNIIAQQVNIEAAVEKKQNDYKYEREQKGLTLAVNVPIVSAIQTALNSVKQVGQSKNDRVNAMSVANAGFDTYKAGQSIAKLKDVATSAQDLTKAAEVSVSLTYGQQKDTSFSHNEATIGASSQVNAGGKVNVVATGAGEQSNINIIGSDVLGKQGTNLIADNDINIKALEQNSSEESGNKSQGWNVGVAVSYGGNGLALGVTAGGNLGKGTGNGDETSHLNSHVGSQGSLTTINSGNATNIIGGQVQGKGVQVTAKELNIESLQDQATYKAKQQNISAQATVGYGASVSGSFSKSNINSKYSSVTEQSGIFAGDDGYQINVQNHTDLKGAIITSMQKAEDEGKNVFTTGTLTKSDINNVSKYDAEGFAIGGSMSVSGESLGQKAPSKGQGLVLSNEGNKGASKSLGFGSDTAKDSSVTQSGVNTKNLTIMDIDQQLALSGKTAEQIKAEIITDVTTETARENSGALKNNFDKDKILSEINLQVSVTKAFRENSLSLVGEFTSNKQAALRDAIKKANSEEEKTELYDELYKLQYQRRFLETLIGIVTLNPDVAITQGTLQLAATKMREESLANSRQSPGMVVVIDGKETVINNVSYDSGYFDGVKLGGVRLDTDTICGENSSRCFTDNNGNLIKDDNGNYRYKGDKDYPTFDAILKDKTKDSPYKNMSGLTGGSQMLGGTLAGIPYKNESFVDSVIESFAGTHDLLGGQIWGWYGKDGNTLTDKTKFQKYASETTTIVAIPVSAPFALADLISPDVLQLIISLGK